MTALAIDPNVLISGALSDARRRANEMRIGGIDSNSWVAGYWFGALTADINFVRFAVIGADQERTLAALHEIRFLFTDYQRTVRR